MPHQVPSVTCEGASAVLTLDSPSADGLSGATIAALSGRHGPGALT